jgi:hypothetical protein
MLSLKLRRLICEYRRAHAVLRVRALVQDGLISVIDAHDLVGFVDSLIRGRTPAIEGRDFLRHVLARFGPAEGQLVFLNTLAWSNSELACHWLLNKGGLNWGC